MTYYLDVKVYGPDGRITPLFSVTPVNDAPDVIGPGDAPDVIGPGDAPDVIGPGDTIEYDYRVYKFRSCHLWFDKTTKGMVRVSRIEVLVEPVT